MKGEIHVVCVVARLALARLAHTLLPRMNDQFPGGRKSSALLIFHPSSWPWDLTPEWKLPTTLTVEMYWELQCNAEGPSQFTPWFICRGSPLEAISRIFSWTPTSPTQDIYHCASNWTIPGHDITLPTVSPIVYHWCNWVHLSLVGSSWRSNQICTQFILLPFSPQWYWKGVFFTQPHSSYTQILNIKGACYLYVEFS